MDFSGATRQDLCILLLNHPARAAAIEAELRSRETMCSWRQIHNILAQRQIESISGDPVLVAYYRTQELPYPTSYALQRMRGRYAPDCFIMYDHSGIYPSCLEPGRYGEK
jgi:hypothetical protein